MVGYGLLMIIFGACIMLAGLYLIKCNKGDFSQVLLWKSNVKKMTVDEVKYAGKISIAVGLGPILSGIVSFFFSEDSIVPIIVLIVSIILFLILAIKTFK